MVDLGHLKELGIDSGTYKGHFSKPIHEMPESLQKLVRLVSSRITDSRRQNLTEWQAHAAVDLAFDTPFAQTTPTIVAHILSKHLDADGTRQALRGWGLDESTLFIDGVVKGTDGTEHKVKLLNPPVAVEILIPIVRAYVAIRLAKIFNDRNVHPLLKYEPLRSTHESQAACEIITDIVDRICHWFGYPAVLRQGLQQMLKYGVALAFPMEEWYCEKQHWSGQDRIVKEGLRYYWPHPTRMNYDTMHPLTSFNTDSGCEWALHWRVIPYSDILDSDLYWNRDSIFQGTNWFAFPNVGSFFEEFYPCSFEPLHGGWTDTAGLPQLREDKQYWYATNNRDRAVFVTEVFMKICPKTWGLGNYPHKLWHRFTIAGDDTVIWANPCAYNPIWFLGYDYDEQANRNASLALEIIPWQDEVGNLLNHIIQTAKNNLAEVVFYNQLAINKGDVDAIKQSGDRRYRETAWVGYDPSMMQAAHINMGEVFTRVGFGGKSIVELLQCIPLVLNLMERVIQISAQEAGSSATHQQSKREVELTAGASTNRVTYSCSFVDEGIGAWKIQIYEASMAYMDPETEAEVSKDIPGVEDVVQKLGFEITGEGDGTLVVKGRTHTLRLESFADTGKGADVLRDKEIAQVIFQTVGTIAGQEDLRKQIGAQKLLMLIERAAILAGAPPDFRLRVDPNAKDEDVPEAIQEAIQKAMQELEQKIAQSLAQPVAKEIAGEQQEIKQLQEAMKVIQGAIQKVQQVTDKNQLRAQETQQRMQQRAVEFQAEEQRKQQAHQAEMERQRLDTQQELAAKAAETQADIENSVVKANADAEIAKAKAEAAPKPKKEK